MWILVFVPLIGFPIAGLLMDDFPFGESLVIGVGIALVMLVVNLLALRRTSSPCGRAWSSISTARRKASIRGGGEDDNYRTYTEYTTIINTDAGKKKTIVERTVGGICTTIFPLATGCGFIQDSVHTRNTINPKTASSTATSAP